MSLPHRGAPPGIRVSRRLPLLALLAVTSLAAAQSPATPQAPPAEGSDAYRVTVELALVQATVRDAQGAYVKGLKQKDFRLLEDGVPQEIVLFSEEPEAPIRVAFLLDLSGSMALQGHLKLARSGIRYFLERLGPSDEAALMAFADNEVQVVVDFTSDKRLLSDALLAQEAYGQTALLDAVAEAPGMVPRAGNARRAIVLFSDGVDNISILTPGEAVQIARRTEVPVYSVGFLDQVERRRADLGAAALEKFSHETGGRVFLAASPYEVNNASRLVVDELKHTYILGYYPSRARAVHALAIEAACDRCLVTSRRGLYASTVDSGS